MSTSEFEYDIFLSFSSADLGAAEKIWLALKESGLRVFWSAESLKNTAGINFFGAIEAGLRKSQHFLLFWTAGARTSTWVEMEYQAFFNHCHLKDKGGRRLFVLPDGFEPTSSLPILLQNLQFARSVEDLVAQLGSTAGREVRHRVDPAMFGDTQQIVEKAAQAHQPSQSGQVAPTKKRSGSTGMLVLAYLGLFAIIPLARGKKDREVYWHAKHGLIITAAYMIVSMVHLAFVNTGTSFNCLSALLSYLPMGAWLILVPLCIFKAVNGQRLHIPGISRLAGE